MLVPCLRRNTRRSTASRICILGTVILSVVAAPFIGALFDALPAWVGLLVLAVVVLGAIRRLFGLLIGRGATDHTVGHLAATSILFLVSLPVRLIAALIRELFAVPARRR